YLAEDHPWLNTAEVARNRADFLDASKAIAKVLLRRQWAVLGQPMAAWLPRLVAAWHDRHSDVFTLNYDTLVEKAYMKMTVDAAVSRGGWERPDHHEIYAVPIPDVSSRQEFWGVHPRLGGTLRLLKLHGSINWCYSG